MDDDSFAAYCASVVQHVRCKLDRPAISAELIAHLEDHADALAEGGVSPEEAARLAVEAMGDAGAVGKALDRAHPPVWGWLVTACHVLIYLCVAVILVYGSYRFVDDGMRISVRSLVNLSTEEDLLEIQKQLWDAEPLETGAVTGGGWLGDYYFQPGGRADVSFLPATEAYGYRVEDRYCIEFPVRISHWQPWLSQPSFYNATFNMNTPIESAHLNDAFVGSGAHFSEWYLAAFYSPVYPEGQSELTISAMSKTVTFTVEWEVGP